MINRKSLMVHMVVLAMSSVAMSSVAVECPPNCAPYARPAPDKRTFRSEAVDHALAAMAARIADPRLRRMFEACYPNTLDTTVRNDGYVITGDIDAMWLRDSGQQMWPYLRFAKDDAKLAELIRSVVRRQFGFMRHDPYANAFYDTARLGEFKNDETAMKPGVHERKWEIDSLCYPLRLAHGYWKATGDTSLFDDSWKRTVRVVLSTFKEQQKKTGQKTSYRFRRKAQNPTDSLSNEGFGPPVKPVGLIASAFRPSDDACTFQFLVPSNFFAVDVLGKAAEILSKVNGDEVLAEECRALASEVSSALKRHAVVETKDFGEIYAFEVDGYGGALLMDDANAPSLLSLPYLCGVSSKDPVYRNTRRFVLSKANPYYFEGLALSGIGSPHTGLGRVWPMSVIMRALTAESDVEARQCLEALAGSTAGTGFIHESVDVNDASKFSRPWFGWANTMFGELVYEMVESGRIAPPVDEPVAWVRPLGHRNDAAFFERRAEYWRNVIDPKTGFARGRDSKGAWREPFSPFALGHDASRKNDFTEGNAWQWTWHVLHDPEGLISALGGKEQAVKRLQALFVQPEKTADSGFTADVTGLIGQYSHGNEPSHHIAYLFQYMDRPDRTAEVVRAICDKFYHATPDGLCGNEDCGQMSAWYVFAAMGFYPLNPASGEYVIGAPQIPKIALDVGCGRKFIVEAKNLSAKNKYVKSVSLNGKVMPGFKLKHSDIVRGGRLVFEMDDGAEPLLSHNGH